MKLLSTNVLLVLPAPQAAPDGVWGYNTSVVSIKVFWNPLTHPIPGILRGYRITYIPLYVTTGINLDKPSTVIAPRDALSFELTGLDVATHYNISVAAFTVKDGPSSVPVILTTHNKILPRKKHLLKQKFTSLPYINFTISKTRASLGLMEQPASLCTSGEGGGEGGEG